MADPDAGRAKMESEDETMQDAAAETEAVEESEQALEAEDMDGVAPDEDEYFAEIEDGKQVRILPGSTPTAASFEFTEEGHTLGNALRYVIMKNPEVEFCAYAIPHPSEAKMNVRIQTYDGTTAVDALTKGLKDLQELCDVVTEKFSEARDNVPKIPAPSKRQLDDDKQPLPLY